jgi:proteasome alpha subunit
VPARDLEVAVLDRTRTQARKFKRVDVRVLTSVLEDGAGTTTDAPVPPATPEEEPPVAPPGS